MTIYIGTNKNDTLVGLDDVSDDLTGKLGNDVLIGGNGFATDWVHYDNAPAAVAVNLAAGTATGGDGNDTLNGIEGVTGSKFNDTLRSGTGFGSSFLYGGAGNDALIGDSGDDFLKGGAGNDTLAGGDGYDSADYSDATSAVTVNLSTGTATGGAGKDTLAGIEEVIGSDFSDILVGGVSFSGNSFSGGKGNDSIVAGDTYYDNWLDGGVGNDSLIGGTGSDTLVGGLGADILAGGDGWGIDTVDYSGAAAAVTVNLAVGTASGGDGNDILKGIENIEGSFYNDTLIGGNNGGSLYADEGNDVLIGGGGTDYLNGGGGDDSLTGNQGDDRLVGSLGDDLLDGGKGTDWATFYGSVTVNLVKGTATGADGNDTLKNIENINGSSGDDTLIGDDNANYFDGGAGNDWLSGGQGDDVLNGYKDVDWASYSDATSSVTVDLIAGTATGGAGNDTLLDIENVQGSKFNDILKGNDGDNSLDGGAGSDALKGGAGNDTLDGRQGKDTLTGGVGSDIFKFTVNGLADKITDFNVIDDTIQLENGIFKALTDTGVLAADQFKVGTKATDANDFVIYNKATGALLYDTDGNGANAAVQVTTVGTGLDMTNADIFVI